MGELLRSVPMQLVQLFVQVEAAHDTVDELAQLGLIQFRDLNPEVNAFQRNFVNEVRRADEMERRLRYFEEEIKKAKIEEASVTASLWVEDSDHSKGTALMDELEARFEEIEQELLQLSANQATLDRNHNELIELRYVLEKDDAFFGPSQAPGSANSGAGESASLLANDKNQRDQEMGRAVSNLGFVTGVLDREKMFSFERVLWRATRGNLFMNQAEIDQPIKDPSTGNLFEKNVFIIFYQGSRAAEKIRKLCESFGANLYPCTEDPRERDELKAQIRTRIADLNVVLERTREHSLRVLKKVAGSLDNWKKTVLKEKAVYHTMNLFNYDVGRKCLIAEGWCPQESTEAVQLALRRATERAGAMVPSILSIVSTQDTPPTHFKTNKFTATYQAMTDSYGVPRYREINPTPFNIVMFPFLFGVMFGDVGHGILLLLVAISFLVFEKKLQAVKLNEMLEMVFAGRYLLLPMAIFAIYCGSLYNEFYAVPMDIFGTAWFYPEGVTTAVCKANSTGTLDNVAVGQFANGTIIYETSTFVYCSYAYPWGVDPLWVGSANMLDYVDSLKMKMSVIFGVIQMSFGVILNSVNMFHFGRYLDIFFIGIPQIVFLTFTFGYMDFLIIYKWLNNWWASSLRQSIVSYEVPLLLNTMIQMFLSPWNVPAADKVYNGQMGVQLTFVLVAVMMAPIMLLCKPFWAKYQHSKKMKEQGYENITHEHASDEEGHTDEGKHETHGEHGEHEEFDFGEEFVHSIIHTIEYILGCVSNTASYLRLWALSLAHSELSDVFLEGFLACVHFHTAAWWQWILIFGAWSVWAAMTVGVLLIMESLSAFLHALRLHWVEFQNKFFAGDGHKFLPLSYQKLLEGDEEALEALAASGGGSPHGA